jgi:hypothetical protein
MRTLEDMHRRSKELLGDSYIMENPKTGIGSKTTPYDSSSSPTQPTQGMDTTSFGVIMIPRRGKRPKQQD